LYLPAVVTRIRLDSCVRLQEIEVGKIAHDVDVEDLGA
jgi:hypothetical protein